MTHSILRFVFILFLVIKPLSAAANNTILILGDSLSAAYGLKQEQGWVQLLQDKYDAEQSNIKLINASISGETTGGALRRVDALLAQYQPTHVLIELGANDGLRGFPVRNTNAYLMDFFVLKVAGQNDLMQNDNLHPNKTAQPILRDEMYNTIKLWLNKG